VSVSLPEGAALELGFKEANVKSRSAGFGGGASGNHFGGALAEGGGERHLKDGDVDV